MKAVDLYGDLWAEFARLTLEGVRRPPSHGLEDMTSRTWRTGRERVFNEMSSVSTPPPASPKP